MKRKYGNTAFQAINKISILFLGDKMDNKNSVNNTNGKIVGINKFLSVIWKRREFAVIFLIIIIIVIMIATSPYFLGKANIRTITASISSDMLVTIGLTLVLIIGGIDVSVGSTLGLAGVFAAEIMSEGANMWPAIGVAILVGLIIGALNGFFISILRVNPLITTLAMQVAVRGVAIAKTHGYLIGGFPEEFEFIGQGKILGIGTPILIGLVIAGIAYFLLNYSSFFQQFYFIGGNEKAARISGINITKVKFIVYLISGLLSGMAGVIVLSRTMIGTSNIGLGTEFRAIPAAVIGGASLMGGEGNIIGPMLGVLLLALINDALVLSGVSAYYQSLAQGVILLFAVSLDAIIHRNEIRS